MMQKWVVVTRSTSACLESMMSRGFSALWAFYRRSASRSCEPRPSGTRTVSPRAGRGGGGQHGRRWPGGYSLRSSCCPSLASPATRRPTVWTRPVTGSALELRWLGTVPSSQAGTGVRTRVVGLQIDEEHRRSSSVVGHVEPLDLRVDPTNATRTRWPSGSRTACCQDRSMPRFNPLMYSRVWLAVWTPTLLDRH